MAAPRGERGLLLLLCRVGSKFCGVPLKHVLETMRPLAIEPLADMPELALGLSMIRGRPTPVIDARRLFGSDAGSAPRRFVTLEVGRNRTAALAVDDVLDVRSVPTTMLEPLPGLLRSQRPDTIASLGALDRELLVVLEQAQLLPESFWQELEQANAS